MLHSGIRSVWHYNIFLATYKPVSLFLWTLCDGPITQYCIAPQIKTYSKEIQFSDLTLRNREFHIWKIIPVDVSLCFSFKTQSPKFWCAPKVHWAPLVPILCMDGLRQAKARQGHKRQRRHACLGGLRVVLAVRLCPPTVDNMLDPVSNASQLVTETLSLEAEQPYLSQHSLCVLSLWLRGKEVNNQIQVGRSMACPFFPNKSLQERGVSSKSHFISHLCHKSHFCHCQPWAKSQFCGGGNSLWS